MIEELPYQYHQEGEVIAAFRYERSCDDFLREVINKGSYQRQLEEMVQDMLLAEEMLHEGGLYEYYKQPPVEELEAALQDALKRIAEYKRQHIHRWVRMQGESVCAICTPSEQLIGLFGTALQQEQEELGYA